MKRTLEPIIVTGPARSGTSLMCAILQAHGVNFTGSIMQQDEYNPLGYFEDRRINDGINKQILSDNGFCPFGQALLPPLDFPAVPQVRELAQMTIGTPDYRYFIKDAKILLLYRTWAEAFEGAKFIIMERETNGHIDSLLHTPFMHRRKNRPAWYAWIQHHKEAAARLELIADTERISYDEIVTGRYDNLEKALIRCGIEIDETKVKNLIL